MRRYETIFIVDPDLTEDLRGQLLEKAKDLISSQDGFLVLCDEWGNKKLAYEIKKKLRGYYVYLDYCGNGALVDELERSFRIDDHVIKFMTILLAENVDLDVLKEELAKAEEANIANEDSDSEEDVDDEDDESEEETENTTDDDEEE